MSDRARRWFTPVAVLQVVLIAPGAVLDGFYSPVADVWWRNAFLDALMRRPLDLLPLAASALLGALLAVRLLKVPRVVRILERDAPSPVLAGARAGGAVITDAVDVRGPRAG